jgi:hypothetical protein
VHGTHHRRYSLGSVRLQLIMFFSGIRSERQLMEQVSYNLAMR